MILNWNNKPARGFSASDDNWTCGPVQRVDMLRTPIAARQKHSPASAVSVMNAAATQDFRAVSALPLIEEVLRRSPAPNQRDQQALDLMTAWRKAGGSRLDVNLDGKIDDPGAAVLDTAWPGLADAVLSPVLGKLTFRLRSIMGDDDPANPSGSAYFGGWYSYVVKDLRSLLGKPVAGAWKTRFCGLGSLPACGAALWGHWMPPRQSWPPPREGIRRPGAPTRRRSGSPSALRKTMRWTNRPTFQQVISFNAHRSR